MKRFFAKILFVLLIGVSLATLGWLVRNHYRQLEERRFIDDAEDCLEQKKFTEAALSLQGALRLNPNSSEAACMMAELFEVQGKRAAVVWRRRAAQLQPGDPTARLDWAQTALTTADLQSASQALEGIDEQTTDSARYHKLMGALAWNLHQPENAERHYLEALRLEPTNQANILNLATIRLRYTNNSTAEAARLCIEQEVTNSVLRLTALRQLITYEIGERNHDLALKYSKELTSRPGANFGDQLQYLHLLSQAQSPFVETWLEQLKHSATNSPERVLGLGKWMARIKGPQSTLTWLRSVPDDVRTTEQVSLLAADCYVSLRDWSGLLEAIKDQNWGEMEAARLALLSLGCRSLGEQTLSRAAWAEALRISAHRLDSFAILSQLTLNWGWIPEREEVMGDIAMQFPMAKSTGLASQN
jgi:cytochrome c-type biogenesis protein CcmH/NrfG